MATKMAWFLPRKDIIALLAWAVEYTHYISSDEHP